MRETLALLPTSSDKHGNPGTTASPVALLRRARESAYADNSGQLGKNPGSRKLRFEEEAWLMRTYVPFQLILGCVLGFVACSDDDKAPLPPQQLGQRNESCETRSDCLPGLVCVNQVCSVDRFNVLP